MKTHASAVAPAWPALAVTLAWPAARPAAWPRHLALVILVGGGTRLRIHSAARGLKACSTVGTLLTVHNAAPPPRGVGTIS